MCALKAITRHPNLLGVAVVASCTASSAAAARTQLRLDCFTAKSALRSVMRRPTAALLVVLARNMLALV